MPRRKKQQKKTRNVRSIVDLRTQRAAGMKKVVEISETAFRSFMRKEELICFKHATFEKLFGDEKAQEEESEQKGDGDTMAVEGALPEEQSKQEHTDAVFSDVWCPAVFDHQEFTIDDEDDIIYVDVLDTRYAPLLSLLKTRKVEDDKKRQELQDSLLREEHMEKVKKEGLDKGKQASSSTSSENAGKLDKTIVSTSTNKAEEVVFVDVRRGRGTHRLPVIEFMAYVHSENVICYNYSAYKKVYKVEDPLERLQHEVSAPQVWIPGRKPEEFLQKEVVYVDKVGPLQACVLEELDQPRVAEESEQILGEQDVAKGDIESLVAAEEQQPIKEPYIEQGKPIDDAWQLVQTKGSKATTKEVLLAVDARLNNLLTVFKQEMKEMKHSILQVQVKVDAVNASVSRVAERTSRMTFAGFYERLHPRAEVAPPITNKTLPYTDKPSLEALGQLCSISGLVGQQMHAHPTPLYAEIDILLKVREQGAEHNIISPNKGQGRVATTTADDEAMVKFSHAVLGEVTKSVGLCTSSRLYRHPTKLSNSPSSKLLYKFVQLERGIIATMEYYGVDVKCIGGAAIISPSFAKLAEPRRLVGEVLSHCPIGLENVKALYDQQRFWLLDI